MVQSAPVANVLVPTLTPRPPTPPRESDNSESKNFFARIFSKDIKSRTPPNVTPASSAESPNPGSGTLRKKVEWSPWTEYKEPPTLSTPLCQTLSPLPPSGERKPIKSILKPYNGPIPHENGLGTNKKLSPPHTFPNLATMLESIVQQLAGKDRSSKLDAYMALSGVLKASDNVPDLRALKDKMGLLTQFIQRDLSAKTESGTSDTVLTINALILLSSFLHKAAIAETLSTDFGAFVVDHSIKTFDDPQMSKDVVKHLMFVVAQQNLSSKVMNIERVGKLISVLHTIENRVKGKSIVTGRYNIYRTLLKQARSCMLSNIDWIQDLFSDMLSSLKDIRTIAITFGLESAISLGNKEQTSRAVSDLFQAEVGDYKFVEYYTGKLRAMIEKNQDGAYVPQIWSVTILFLRGRPRQLEQWAFMKLWLEIIQLCFNCSDRQIKIEANFAWNRFIYAIRPDENTSTTTVKLLAQPLIAQLRRKVGKLGNTNKVRQSAIASLCTLLYYSLRPNSSTAQLDLYWDEYVVQLVAQLTPADGLERSNGGEHDLATACAILSGLFDASTPRTWNETRGTDPEFVKTSELPALDPKWLRKNASRVFSVLEPLIERLYWKLPDEKSPISILWRTYLKSIASAGAKEVKVSNDTMGCVAAIFNMLYKLWHKGPKGLRTLSPGGSLEFLASFSHITLTTISELGLLPFTEKLLSIGHQDTFQVIATPSHQPGTQVGGRKCPLHHLFLLLASESPDLHYGSVYLQTVGGILPSNYRQVVSGLLTPFFDVRGSSKAKMDLVRDLLQLLPSPSTEACRILWRVLQDFATLATDIRDENSSGGSGSSDLPLGQDYRNTTNVLEVGIVLSPDVALPGWKSLFEALITRATIDAGDGGRAIAVIEPLSKALLTKVQWTGKQTGAWSLSYCQMLASKATYPNDRQALDAARRRLWGTASTGAKVFLFDPYTYLYDYISKCLQKAYASFTEDLVNDYSSVLSTLTAMLTRCPTSLTTNALVKLQGGISCWIMDENCCCTSDVSRAVTSLWSMISSRVPHLAPLSGHSALLSSLELLICSGLGSKHRSTASSAITMWNEIFGSYDGNLDYPQSIRDALLRLQPLADVKLPSVPNSIESQSPAGQQEQVNFMESQDSNDLFNSTGLDSVFGGQHTLQIGSSLSLPRQSSPRGFIEVAQSIPQKRSREATPETGKSKATKRNLTPKLRHDDSQIHFAPIESSPLIDMIMDSQLLTDRQKEVKERQQAEAAAMFPDIRSSPWPKSKSAEKKATRSIRLPLHRSASETRSDPVVQRQTTPTLIQEGEDDDFIASSPTPTRKLGDSSNISAPPSSPPEAAANEGSRNQTSLDEEVDIPSSPPQPIRLDDTTEPSNLDEEIDIPSSPPDREISPDPEDNIVKSSLHSSPERSQQLEDNVAKASPRSAAALSLKLLRNATTSLDPSAQLDPHSQGSPELFAAENAQEAYREPSPVSASHANISKQRPSTPASEHVRLTPQHTPKDVFMDALSSPASSDKQTVNEDVFEDAISSPQLGMKRVEQAKQRISSPLSDFNESSMLRIMTEFDKGSGRPLQQDAVDGSGAERITALASNDGSEYERPKSSLTHASASDASDCIVVFVPEGLRILKGSHSRPLGSSHSDKGRRKPSRNSRQSLPLSILETPDKTTRRNKQGSSEVKHQKFSVAVEIPARRSPRRKSSQLLGIQTSPEAVYKRKHDESEVPDSQEANIQVPTEIDAPPKKRRGRPSSQAYVKTGEKPQASPSASFDLDESFGNLDNIDDPPKIINSTPDTAFNKETQSQDAASILDAGPDTSVSNKSERLSSANKVVAETTCEESSFLEQPSAAASKSAGNTGTETLVAAFAHPAMMPEQEASLLLSSSSRDLESEVDTTSPEVTEVTEGPLSTERSVAEKLQSIISDLNTASLSREEVHRLEDLFMDAKRKLYDAESRGRRLGEN